MLLIGFVVFVVVLGIALTRRTQSMAISKVLLRLQDSTAQIRVRGAMLFALVFPTAALSLLRRCEVTEPTLAPPVRRMRAYPNDGPA